MMLDSKASDLDKEERPEVLSRLPPYEGKSVLKLGAGIGRFTGELADKAGQLVALDFIESVIKKNENINGHHKNVKFICADVTSPELTFSEQSLDLIFSNWLLMYLSDVEVENLAERMIKRLKLVAIYFSENHVSISLETTRERITPLITVNQDFIPRCLKNVICMLILRTCLNLLLLGCKCIGAYVKNKKNQIRFAGFGKRLAQTLTGDSRSSWILSNINAVAYCATSVSLGMVS